MRGLYSYCMTSELCHVCLRWLFASPTLSLGMVEYMLHISLISVFSYNINLLHLTFYLSQHNHVPHTLKINTMLASIVDRRREEHDCVVIDRMSGEAG